MLTKNTKLDHKGAWPRSRDLFLDFGTPLLSPVKMKIQPANFAAGSRVMNTRQKMKNWAKRGRGLGHVTYFRILGPPIISGYDEHTKVKFCRRNKVKGY